MNSSLPAPIGLNPDDRLVAVSLEEAFARWQDELLGALFYLVGNREDARDALQETFIKCWRHRGSLTAVENLKAWIFRIALNTGRDLRGTAWRRRRQELSEGGAALPSRDGQIGAGLEQQEQRAALKRALAELRIEEQEVFLLRQNGGMTYEEIALSLEIPVGTVKTRMRLALDKLRRSLAP